MGWEWSKATMCLVARFYGCALFREPPRRIAWQALAGSEYWRGEDGTVLVIWPGRR